MGFLNNAITQFNNVFQTLSVGARIVAGLLLLVVVISLAYLFNRQSAAPDSFLFGGEAVTAAELPNIEAAFGKASLKNYSIEANRIRVPRGEESTYMAALADGQAIPASYGSYIRGAIDNKGMFESKGIQEKRLQHGKEMELAQIVSKMHGIGRASVLFDTREEGGINRHKIFFRCRLRRNHRLDPARGITRPSDPSSRRGFVCRNEARERGCHRSQEQSFVCSRPSGRIAQRDSRSDVPDNSCL